MKYILLFVFTLFSYTSHSNECTHERLFDKEAKELRSRAFGDNSSYIAIRFFDTIIYLPNRFMISRQSKPEGLVLSSFFPLQKSYFSCDLQSQIYSSIRTGNIDDCMLCSQSDVEDSVDLVKKNLSGPLKLSLWQYRFSENEIISVFFDETQFLQVIDRNPALHEYIERELSNIER